MHGFTVIQLFSDQPGYVLNRLQSVLNAAAKLVYGIERFNYICYTIRDKLHWLRAGDRVDCKLYLLVYQAVHGLGAGLHCGNV